MYGLTSQVANLKKRVEQYHEILENTKRYREAWKESLKDTIIEELSKHIEAIGLKATTSTKGDFENLEAIVISLGDERSGMYQKVNDEVKKHLIKHNGSLIYQQLFNGKIIVLINFPFIEGYGEPRPPKTVGIYRPEELTTPFFCRHLEEFVMEVSNWEDYDDDEPTSPSRIGFQLNFGQDGTVEDS